MKRIKSTITITCPKCKEKITIKIKSIDELQDRLDAMEEIFDKQETKKAKYDVPEGFDFLFK